MLRLNLFLLLLVVICAISTVSANHRARKLFTEIEREQAHMRNLDVEWGQLQLEQSTWASHARIEEIARDRLRMKVPAANQVMMVEAAGTAGAGSATAKARGLAKSGGGTP